MAYRYYVHRRHRALNSEHSARNAAIARLMKSFGTFHHDVPTVLQNYPLLCVENELHVELARRLSSSGESGESASRRAGSHPGMQARQINAPMATSRRIECRRVCSRVGLPAKSGVGGGICRRHSAAHESGDKPSESGAGSCGNSWQVSPGAINTNVRTFGEYWMNA